MFKGLSEGWPAESFIPPYIRPAEERSHDFDLVNQGYLGYMNLGYSLREVELFVWLEVLRDKQCDERPCEVGVLLEGQKKKKLGGCPVKIHIPEMIDLIGKGRIREALELIEAATRFPTSPGGFARRKTSARACAPTPSGRSRSASSNGICPSTKSWPIRTA